MRVPADPSLAPGSPTCQQHSEQLSETQSTTMENIRSNFSDTNQGLEDRGVILGSAPDFLNEPDNSLLCAAGWHIPSGNHNNLLPSPGAAGGCGSPPLCPPGLLQTSS